MRGASFVAVAFALVAACSSTAPPVPVTPTPAATTNTVRPTASPSLTPARTATAPAATATATAMPERTLGATSARTPAVAFRDGTHRVPEDVAPGTYRSMGTTHDCFWTRLSGFRSGLDDIIASYVDSGYGLVTIDEDDVGFDSVGCGGWTSDLSPVTESRTEFGDGTFIVGTDIDAGQYTATAGDSCEWARLSGFGGERRDIIEREFVNTGRPPTVVIEGGDVGFRSDGCGTWRRSGSASSEGPSPARS